MFFELLVTFFSTMLGATSSVIFQPTESARVPVSSFMAFADVSVICFSLGRVAYCMRVFIVALGKRLRFGYQVS